jgi:tetratricopeptide (TPR) repeat protein
MVGSLSLAVAGWGIAYLAAWHRQSREPLTVGERAYDRRDWEGAARSAREVLKARPGDPAALRLLARSSVQLGRDDAAIAIYTRRLETKGFQAEDYLLMGVVLKRQGKNDAAMLAWNQALETEPVPARVLGDLADLFYEEAVVNEAPEALKPHPLDAAARAAERLGRLPGGETRGDMMLGIVRGDSLDFTGAAAAFRRMLDRDPNMAASHTNPVKLRKLLARTFLRVGRPEEARPHLRSILAGGPDAEASWLLSRVFLQRGAIAEAQEALARAGPYRRDHPLEDEPGLHVGEARCQTCHAAIFRDSLANRHTQTFHGGPQLRGLPRPDRPLADPADARVTHVIKEVDGALWEETRVGDAVLRSLVEYAFGTSERYLTMVSHDGRDHYRMARLSYYHTADGQGWDRTFLAAADPTRAEDFQGEPIGARAGVASCLDCHTTFPRAGRERTGPEAADRAIGCERCHGPGGNHVAAVAAGFSDPAIVNPASASPGAVTRERCNKCHILDPRYRQGDREKPDWVRSQGAGWAWSRCNTESGGALGCVTCHDPHKGVRATTTAQYEAKCLACHSATAAPPDGGPATAAGRSTKPRPRACSVDAAKGCIKCHMPGVRMDSSHREFIDHHIRISRAATAR